MSLLGDFRSKHRDLRLQPSEIHLLADLAVLFYVYRGRFPTRDELKALWLEMDQYT